MSKKIAMAVENKKGMESHIDSRFGRASAFIVVDPDKSDITDVLENHTPEFGLCAGVNAVLSIKDKQICAVLTGKIGPKSQAILDMLNIETWIAPDGISAKEAFERFQAGTLKQSAEIFV